VFWFNFITKVDLSVIIGIESGNIINSNVLDIFTSPISFTFLIVFEWVDTVEWFSIWAVISSPFIFRNNNTIIKFTSTDISVSVGITVEHKDLIVITINIVSKIELTISIRIHGVHNFFSHIENIITVPSTFTNWFTIIITIDMTEIWAVFISPSVFNHFNTLVDFTSFNGSIIIEITFSS
jgi:hypothetical protein